MPSSLLLGARVERVGPFEQHTLPGGQVVYYHDERHAYFTGCREKQSGEWAGVGRLTGVSTVVKPFDWYPEHLIAWAARTNCEGIAALYAEQVAAESLEEMRAGLAWLTSGESIDGALADAKLRYVDHRDDAARRGTNVHRHALHALASGAPVPARDQLTDEEWGYARGVTAFWHECEPEPVAAEFVVCDLGLGVAGRADLLADVTYNGCRQRALIDAKTSGYVPVTHHVQIAGYRHCAELSGYGSTDCGLILQVDAEGGYELVPACATRGDFLAAVDLYRRAARVKRDLTAARKQVTA